MQDQFNQVATLIGDPVRAKILWALMDKRAYTATELAVYADTTAQNISMHLSKLVKADLLTVESQGRHKYYNYSRPEIAYAIEALASLLPKRESKQVNTADEKPIRFCRSCYDHLAGKVGVMLTDSLLKQEYLVRNASSFSVSGSGEVWFDQLGINLDELKKQKRHFAKPCLDWSERKHHLAGALGAALLTKIIADGWVRRIAGSRAITVTRKGEEAFLEHFKTGIH